MCALWNYMHGNNRSGWHLHCSFPGMNRYRTTGKRVTLSLVILPFLFTNGSITHTRLPGHAGGDKDPETVYTIKRVPHPVSVLNGGDFHLNLPEGYTVSVAYEGLKRLRFLTKSPDGRLFATDMHDLSDNRKSKIYIFDGWDEKNKRFKTVHTYLQQLRNVTQVAFYREGDKDYIYIPETHRLTRYVYKEGDLSPRGKPELIATFPAYGQSYKYGGWHLTRSVAFYNKKLYVSVGSSCNACIEKEKVRAAILEMDPDGSNPKIFASGLRNSVGMKWINGRLWVTNMGQDHLGHNRPEDFFTDVQRGASFGWPYYYQYQGQVYADEKFRDSSGSRTGIKPALAFCGFSGHSAPLGFDYFKDFSDERIRNKFLVALHGSTDVSLQRGYSLALITDDGKYTTFIDGFLTGSTMTSRKGRPCDVLMNDARSFFITDDLHGVLYYINRE